MKISVEHSTVYHYEGAVLLEPHIFRLRPRVDSTQRLILFEMRIAPQPVGSTDCLDQDGNVATHAWFGALTRELSVVSRFQVEMLRANPFDFAIGGESLKLPLWYVEPLCSALVSYRNDGQVSEGVKEFARWMAAESGWEALAFLARLNQHLFENWHHVTRPEGSPWTSAETLRLKEGSCRDLAVLFCDVCRVMGIAARFVSGYECAAAGGPDSYMHAWAEVYLPSAGWRGYDPTRGLAVADRHVAVAAGFDSNLAAPVAGMFSGWSGSRMEATIRMDVDPG
jgi:transglutaminase-like putative cysteine protease